jgi:hypothetical protein
VVTNWPSMSVTLFHRKLVAKLCLCPLFYFIDALIRVWIPTGIVKCGTQIVEQEEVASLWNPFSTFCHNMDRIVLLSV